MVLRPAFFLAATIPLFALQRWLSLYPLLSFVFRRWLHDGNLGFLPDEERDGNFRTSTHCLIAWRSARETVSCRPREGPPGHVPISAESIPYSSLCIPPTAQTEFSPGPTRAEGGACRERGRKPL